MNRVHIILWGQESGLISKDKCASEKTITQLEDFANLVAAHEREAIAADADWCIQNNLEHLIPERIRARST
jgi:hypothetical protein